jgi:hypothetical protein
MKSPLSTTIRAIVVLALSPVPVAACGGAVEPGVPDTNGGNGSGGGSGSSGVVDTGSSGGASSGGTSGGGTSGGNSGTTSSSGASSGSTSGSTGGTSSGVPEDASDCAPEWLTGQAGQGGTVLFPCGLPSDPQQTCHVYCDPAGSGNYYLRCSVLANNGVSTNAGGAPWDDTDAGANPVLVGCYLDATGRRPAGLVQERRREARSVGDVLAEAAYLEDASIDAFLDLALQVEAYDAPAALVTRLRRAAAEEVRHADVMAVLARAHGGSPRPVRVDPTGPRSLFSIALENAREGCVRETWGAACAVAQGQRAADREVRGAMQVIARDELGHAALSWDLAVWLDTRLTEEERRAVGVERERAIDELEREIEGTFPEPWRDELGMPSIEEARAIFDGMRAEVWASRRAA